METVMIDEAWFNGGARPVIDVFPDEERNDAGTEVIGQKRDTETGLLRWRIEFPFKSPGDRRAQMAMVTVTSATEPDLIGKVPVFGGVFARKWHMEQRGRATSGLALSAESYSTADERPSLKRAAKPDPPVPNGQQPASAAKT